MSAKTVWMRYRGHVYLLDGRNWRGRDGHSVHLLTWVTDDVLRQEGSELDGGELALARLVAEKLGVSADDVGDGPIANDQGAGSP